MGILTKARDEQPSVAATSAAKSRQVTWVLVAALGWLGLVVLSVWIKAQPASWWRVLEAPVSVVAGGFAAVVVAALLFDPITKWVARAAADEMEHREDHRWLTDRYPHARATQDDLRHLTAVGSALVYEAVASTGALPAVIPSETLRWDARRLPQIPPSLDASKGQEPLQEAMVAIYQGLAKALEEDERSRWTGPMAVARIQIEMVTTAMLVHVEEEQIAEAVRIMGPASAWTADDLVWLAPARRGPVPDEMWDRLDDSTVEALASCPSASLADNLAVLASRMLSMSKAVTGARDFDPAPLIRSVLALMVQTERMRYLASSPAARAVVNGDGTVRDRRSDDPWLNARDRMIMVGRLFRALMDVRDQLRQSTAGTLLAASLMGANTVNAWMDDPSGSDDIFGTDASWDLWRQRNHLKFEGPEHPGGA